MKSEYMKPELNLTSGLDRNFVTIPPAASGENAILLVFISEVNFTNSYFFLMCHSVNIPQESSGKLLV